ncbi:RNA polymerase sigma factor [Spirosoma linguale]|uniref:RNA polymerase, sigma-24 subunit, ECF subfamily n=1 Tax=Spirosoma linguale (strain ATCC 33905 / DSM 74 / LMG 10896 / Claus 1) TaxID=504472 RepID=D2QTF2_SPILD|nr:RNA polymerase, sigma-24 subunit, ECF subfamily [Spirosoma linguale DSM 74]
MAPLSDQALITLYLTTNDKQFFAQLYTRHRYRVYQVCLCFCEDPYEADDFTQEIFIRLTHKINRFSGTARFTTWLTRVTTNYCIDQLRDRQHQQALFQRYTNELERLNHGSAEAEETALQLMQRVLHQLSASERELLAIKYADNVTLKSIAHKHKLSLSAVKMRIKRARERARLLYRQLHAQAEHSL